MFKSCTSNYNSMVLKSLQINEISGKVMEIIFLTFPTMFRSFEPLENVESSQIGTYTAMAVRHGTLSK